MARPVAVDPHDRRRSPSQRRTSPSHPLGRTPGEKQCPRSDKPPGQTVNTADSARTMSGALVLDFFGELPTFVGVVVSVQGAGTIVGGRRFSMGPSTRSDGTVTVGRAV